MYTIVEKLDWGKLATFVPNKKIPVYNWFYYKEGFARELVMQFINEFNINEKTTVLDPFCGSGNTLLACKELGINAIGFDVLPISVFASRVKTRNYDLIELRRAADKLFEKRFQRPEIINVPSIMKRAFSRYALEDIIFFKEQLRETENNEAAHDLLLLALINAAMKVSWAWKDGGIIKIKKHPAPPLRKLYRRIISRMIKDLKSFRSKPCRIEVDHGDARRIALPSESIDAVITSPPYLNNIDYTKVYEIENWFLEDADMPAIRSYIGLGKEEKFLEELNLPPQAQAYFKDMNIVIEELARVCRDGANVAIIVGNAWLADKVIESDMILAELVEKSDFKVEKIMILNKRAALRNRTEKTGVLRESAVISQKI